MNWNVSLYFYFLCFFFFVSFFLFFDILLYCWSCFNISFSFYHFIFVYPNHCWLLMCFVRSSATHHRTSIALYRLICSSFSLSLSHTLIFRFFHSLILLLLMLLLLCLYWLLNNVDRPLTIRCSHIDFSLFKWGKQLKLKHIVRWKGKKITQKTLRWRVS